MTVILVTLILSTLTHTVLSANLPIVINTWAFIDAANEAWKVLHQPHKTALDALVEGCSTCERMQCDGTVGYGGSPDEHGETTLDAMIMDGATMNIGAVAALRNIKHAIRVARHVLENTQHTLLVGDQASQFAQMMGFQKESLSTPASKEIWRKWWAEGCQPNFWVNVRPDPRGSCGPYKPEPNYRPLSLDRDNEKFGFGYKNHDTIGMIVIDSSGHIYAGTSTNGASHKIPGRVGDSPVPGAGAYADNEFGAAAATGDGDVMMRFLPSFVAVENLRAGQNPTTAAQNALKRILKHHAKFMGGLIVVNRLGEFGAACTGIDKFPFSVASGNQTKAKIEYIDYLSWLPHRKALIDIFRVAFGNAEYVSIRKSLQNNFQPKVMSMETEGLEGVFSDKHSPGMIEALELDDQHCFVANKEANKSLGVFCVEHGDKGLKFVHKNDIKREGVMQIVSLEKNLIVILLNDSVEICKPNEPEKCKQKIPAVTPSQIAAVVTGDSEKFIAICSKIKPKSFHHGLVDIYRSTDEGNPFELMQTIEVVSPLQVEFLVLPQSRDILLNVLTESFNEPLAIYQYKGVLGFQSIVGSSTLTPGTSISVIHLKASQQHLIAMMSKDELTFVEAVLHKT